MPLWGEKAALDSLVAEHRARELQDAPAQSDLFEPSTARARLPPPGHGRRWGSRNKRTDEAARIYMAEHGDPLKRGVQIAALPVLADGVLSRLADALGCSRFDAAKWWAGIYQATMPYLHTRQASLTVKPEGAPDGDPVDWLFSDGEGPAEDDAGEDGLTIEGEAEDGAAEDGAEDGAAEDGAAEDGAEDGAAELAGWRR